MSAPRHHWSFFANGTPLLVALATLLAVIITSYLTWFVSLPTFFAGQNQALFVKSLEAIPSLGAPIIFALLAPRVPLWHTLGSRRARWHTTTAAMAALLALAVTPLLIYAALAWQPIDRIPGFHEVFNGNGSLDFTTQVALASFAIMSGNILFFAGIGCLAVALCGTVVGVALTYGVYFLVLLGHSSDATAGYIPLMSSPREWTPLNFAVGLGFAVVGLVVWHLARASAPLRRKFKFATATH